MYKELGLSEADGVLAAYNAVCELVEETERLQAACAAKEAELAELRGQTAELFGARLEAEGMGEEAVTAAKAMWQSDPQSVAMATLGCDFAEAANPYGCNQYGHGFKEPHGAAGGRGQKTFDFFSETQKEVNKDRRKAQRAYDSATKDTEKALERVKETAEAVERFANSPDDKTKSMDELISEADKLKEANKQAIKDAKAARRRQLEAAREAGKKVKPAFNGNKNGNIDDELYDEFKDVFDDDDVKSSRTLEELLEEEDIVNAANPYGCNQYGHEWRGKHGEGWKPSGRGGNEKRGETAEERTKRVVVGSIKEAKQVLEELNKTIGKPPYDISDPRARAKINLEHELTRTQERDTEEAAERLKKVTEGAQEALKQGEKKEVSLSDTEADDLVGDLFEIAMEEGGYEKLYDAPKEKLKAVIKKELMKSGSRDMFGNYDTGEDGNPAKYRWWRKNVKRIVDSI